MDFGRGFDGRRMKNGIFTDPPSCRAISPRMDRDASLDTSRSQGQQTQTMMPDNDG
jgi:hypothetical protein